METGYIDRMKFKGGVNKTQFVILIVFNVILALVHISSGIFILVQSKRWNTQTAVRYQDWVRMGDAEEAECTVDTPCQLTDATRSVKTKFNGVAACAAFSMISGVGHLCCVLFHKYYITNVFVHCTNPIRWIDYSASAPCMILVVSVLIGIRDAPILGLNFIIMTAIIGCGWITEELRAHFNKIYPKYKQSKNPTEHIWKLPTLVAWILYMGLWTVLMIKFHTAIHETEAPTFVHAIVYVLFITFSSFAILQTVDIWSNKTPYYVIELAFQSLSLISKQTLLWQLYFGLVSRTGILKQ